MITAHKFTSVACSPLTRAMETKNIVLVENPYNLFISAGFKENEPAARLLLEPKDNPSEDEENLVKNFINTVKTSTEVALQMLSPILIIAHLGTFLALKKIYQIKDDNMLDNCQLVRFSSNKEDIWEIAYNVEKPTHNFNLL